MVRILVGCPTSSHKAYCLNEYAAGIKAMQGAFDVLVVDNSQDDAYLHAIKKAGLPVVKGPWKEGARDRIVESRNVLRKKVLDEGYDYFFSLEQDVIPPPDVLMELLKHGKDIVSGIYTKNYQLLDDDDREVGREELPLIWVDVNGQPKQLHSKGLEPPRLLRIVASGLGCVLIHRSVLEKIPFRWEHGRNAFDDMWFYADAKKEGFSIWADTGVRCQHLEMSWEGIKK